MPSRKAPEPEYLVLCSSDVDWRSQAETVASFGRPMMVWGAADEDLNFVEALTTKHRLKSVIDRENRKYLLWKSKPLPTPEWSGQSDSIL